MKIRKASVLVALAVASASILTGCNSAPPNLLAKTWSCASDTKLTFREDGTFTVVTGAAEKKDTVDGRYTQSNNLIKVEGPILFPLGEVTTIESVDPNTLLLSTPINGLTQCSRSGT